MAIARYLAMTADEFANAEILPENMAWMACHFSPYSSSVTNLPKNLPAGSLLILNDSTPPSGQDPDRVAQVLTTVLKSQKCRGLLLDFQHSNNPQLHKIAHRITQLAFPVCVSHIYANDLDCPVFLPPPPLTIPLSEYIKPWQNKQIWLDITKNCEKITVTNKASISSPLSYASDCKLSDKQLHCHYKIERHTDSFIFTLQRTQEDLDDLITEAETLGITTAVGLYQELK